jgi:hypothetical protein
MEKQLEVRACFSLVFVIALMGNTGDPELEEASAAKIARKADLTQCSHGDVVGLVLR